MLTRMNFQIKKARDIMKVVDAFEYYAIIHNLLLDYGDEDNLEWHERVFEDVDHYECEHGDVNEGIDDDVI